MLCCAAPRGARSLLLLHRFFCARWTDTLDTRMAWCAVARGICMPCMRMHRMDGRARGVVQPKAAAVRVPAQAFAAPPADTAPARAAHAEPPPAAGHRPHAAPFHAASLLLFSSRHGMPCHGSVSCACAAAGGRAVR